MNNKLFFFNKWLENNKDVVGQIVIITSILYLLSVFLINTTFVSIILTITLILLLIVRIRLRFVVPDRSKFNIPEIGQVLIVKKEFNYIHGKFTKPKYKHRYLKHIKFEVNQELKITNIRSTLDYDYIIYLKVDDSYEIELRYFETHKYLESISQIRNNKLEKLGI